MNRRKSKNSKSLDIILCSCDGQLSEYKGKVFIFLILGDLNKFWLKSLTCTTPRGKEFDNYNFIWVLCQ
jgi:hypothetical protein